MSYDVLIKNVTGLSARNQYEVCGPQFFIRMYSFVFLGLPPLEDLRALDGGDLASPTRGRGFSLESLLIKKMPTSCYGYYVVPSRITSISKIASHFANAFGGLGLTAFKGKEKRLK